MGAPTAQQPPRLAARTVLITFASIALILIAVVAVLIYNLRERAIAGVIENLAAGARIVTVLDERRDRQFALHAEDAARDLNLGLALTRLQTGPEPTDDEVHAFLELLEREIHLLEDKVRPDAIAILDRARRVVARTGRDVASWVPGTVVSAGDIARTPGERVYETGGTHYRVLVLPIRAASDEPVGELHLATALNDDYAEALSTLTRTQTVVLVGGRLVASTLTPGSRDAVGQALRWGVPTGDRFRVGGTTWAVAPLKSVDDAVILAVDPLDRAHLAAWREVMFVLGPVGLGALLLGGLASLWLARTLSRPIDDLSHTLAEMASSRRFDVRLPRPGTSWELNALTDTFNDLMRSLATAEAETRSAYVGAIRGLAAALDARDPYTAGHSERVSALAVSIGRHMTLPDRDVDVLRLGALLHDIGKIGVSDDVLRKPGPLTAEEFEAIKLHARQGSRILRSVPFLLPHAAIVELHHERPDGLGYPHGLAGDEVPLLARIVRVADAFDAMTTARAYRPARPAPDALAELWRHAGSQFDAEVVEALAAVWPTDPPRAPSAAGTESRSPEHRTPA